MPRPPPVTSAFLPETSNRSTRASYDPAIRVEPLKHGAPPVDHRSVRGNRTVVPYTDGILRPCDD
jgi:hypothetical protein